MTIEDERYLESHGITMRTRQKGDYAYMPDTVDFLNPNASMLMVIHAGDEAVGVMRLRKTEHDDPVFFGKWLNQKEDPEIAKERDRWKR